MALLKKKMMLAVTLLFASSFASAAVHGLDLTAGSNNASVSVNSVGVFYDLFNFTLTEESSLDQSLTPLAGTLYYLSFSIFESGAMTPSYVATTIGSGLGVDGVLLQAGNYTTVVLGVLGGVTGSYALATSVSLVSPVPEASALAMLLGGLGLVGFMAHRRKVA